LFLIHTQPNNIIDVQVKNTGSRIAQSQSVILIASPDVQLRARWRRILKGRFLAYEAGDKREFDHALTYLKPAVLLLDLALHRLGEFTRFLRFNG
jgi:hypothetical protein